MLGERKPDHSFFEPSWHHTYAMLAWDKPLAQHDEPLHYPPIHPERVKLTALLYRLANDPAERARFVANPSAYAAATDLAREERDALAALDQARMLTLGIHPLVFFLAQMQIEQQRKR